MNTMEHSAENFEIALTRWLEQAQKISDDYMAAHFPKNFRPTLSLERGKRYVRVVKNEQWGRNCHCFIDTTNGDVLKSASWKAPAKGARGSIYNPEQPGVSAYGGLYR